MRTIKAILFFTLILLCQGCSSDSYNVVDPEEYQYHETSIGVVGTLGGQLLVTDPNSDLFGCGVFIEEGALNQAINIELSISHNTAILDHPEAVVIEFSPSGTTFNKPVIISLSYRHINSADGSDIIPVYFDSNANILTNLNAISVLADDKIILAETDHFSGYAAIQTTNNANTFTDTRDGKKYKTVSIGGQTWMAENLAYLPMVFDSYDDRGHDLLYYVYDYEGTDLPEASSLYNYQTYGTLYNYAAAMSACPSGWHLPSDDEWKMLERKLGMDENDIDEEAPHDRSSGEVGYQLKSTFGWDDNVNASNSSGFSALPGGSLLGSFDGIGNSAVFWTSTIQREAGALRWIWYRSLPISWKGVFRNYGSQSYGLSVRCVR